MAKKILIVDDEEWISSVLQDYLEDSGYQVVVAPTLADARERIEKEALPDAFVLDLTLPDGSGTSLLDEIRANDRTKNIPIIMITAHTVQKIANAIKGRMPDDCIIKPFNLREFRNRLEQQIQSHS